MDAPTDPPKPKSPREAQRESREAQLLELALGMLVKDGYLGLTMDKLALAAGYAKGTLYLHFKNKEDLICALLRTFQERRMRLFDRISNLDTPEFEVPHRGRLMGLGLAAEVFVLAYPENARIEPILKMSSLREKASPERCAALEAIEGHCYESVLATAQAAIRDGDMTVENDLEAPALVTGLWAMHMGLNLLHSMGPEACPLSRDPSTADLRPMDAMQPVAQRLLDGYGWRPLSHEFDYGALRKKLMQTCFADEAAMMATNNENHAS